MWLRNRVAGQRSRALVDWPYPFVEDELFILTLSAGLEGYNVQVDGRHVASFPYRIGFILEDAATVHVNGDVEVGSMVAGTLPTAHPNILHRNLELLAELKAPPPEEPVELFIGILSAGSHFTERMAARRSWMSAVRNSSSTMACFFVALNGRKEVNEDLKKEADFFRDIIIVPFVDSYDLVVLKTVAICEYAARVVSAKYVMKCEDDTFVRLDSVMAEIKKIPDDKSFYMGNMNYYHRSLRQGKWAVSYEEWPRATYPPYADGPGYIISSDIANFVVLEMEKGRLNVSSLCFNMFCSLCSFSMHSRILHSTRILESEAPTGLAALVPLHDATFDWRKHEKRHEPNHAWAEKMAHIRKAKKAVSIHRLNASLCARVV